MYSKQQKGDESGIVEIKGTMKSLSCDVRSLPLSLRHVSWSDERQLLFTLTVKWHLNQ